MGKSESIDLPIDLTDHFHNTETSSRYVYHFSHQRQPGGQPDSIPGKLTVAGPFNRPIPPARAFRINGQLRRQPNAYDGQPCQFNRFTIDRLRGK